MGRHPRNRRRRAGFIILFGWRTVSTSDGTSPVSCKCPSCEAENAQIVGRRRRNWFTLFFIPVFPMDSAENVQRVCQCMECREVFEMPVEQFARRLRSNILRNRSATFVLYNELREYPEDGQRLLRLLEMYEALGEYGEAEAAARHFPKALAAEPRCLLALGRICEETEFKSVAAY